MDVTHTVDDVQPRTIDRVERVYVATPERAPRARGTRRVGATAMYASPRGGLSRRSARKRNERACRPRQEEAVAPGDHDASVRTSTADVYRSGHMGEHVPASVDRRTSREPRRQQEEERDSGRHA
jgi:hypothetical protein